MRGAQDRLTNNGNGDDGSCDDCNSDGCGDNGNDGGGSNKPKQELALRRRTTKLAQGHRRLAFAA